ncbi:DNA-processing protein DprA [Paenibacillus sp.]|uniref:DNA-processing protein DprA n=1 Tax=Paenibacillus sp. TaxID=58172 RepID=UPI002D4EC821|nr:DNA-processing protein DprA [Paenibacillus sp.]HZG57903.1 DNA-processing protein DprA [Paenibacillus sp.]
MEERHILFGLQEIDGIGWETVEAVAGAVPDLRTLLERPATELLAGTKVSRTKAEKIQRVLTNEFILSKLRFYENAGVEPITYFDARYPPLLRHGIEKPPWVLYCRGDVTLLQRNCAAVVGTRHPTAYGREVAEWFGAELAEAGVPVVSGLARGIDGYAHAGALRTTGATIAVLGNGLNLCYPPEHEALQRAIGKRGLVLSEYSWNAKPSKLTFPWRNRLIAGIARGTVVVEAARRSGSLHTAKCATNASRDIFAVPGPITSPNSEGCFGLLREGAIMATSPRDVLAEFGLAAPAEAQGGTDANVTPDEAELLAALGGEAASIDELIERTHRSFGHLHTVLLSLLVKNRIRALPGSRYIARMK